MVSNGMASTAAMKGSTEEAQFEDNGSEEAAQNGYVEEEPRNIPIFKF